MRLTSNQRKLLKWVGYPLLALLTFVFTLAYTFPYDRLKDKIVEGLSDKYDVSIMSVEPTLVPGAFVIKTMVLRTRPKTADEKPAVVLIDEIEVNVGVMSALLWSVDVASIGVEIEAQIAGGSLGIEIEHAKGSNTISLAAHTKMLPIGSLPGVAEAVGLPMTGGISADIDVTLPQGKWSKASGFIKFSCIGCTVGDGIAKMTMKPQPGSANNRRAQRRNAFASDGLTVPQLNLGAVLGEIEIDNGTGEIKAFSAKSQDGFLSVTGDIDFKDPFNQTLFPGCMTFGFSEELKAREPKFMGIEAGLPPKAKQADGSYSIPTKGKLVALRFDVRRQCGDKSSGSNVASKRSRPKITTKDPKKVEPRKMPDLSKETTEDSNDDSESKDDSTESGPKIGARFSDVKERAELLNAKSDEASDEADSDEEEAGEDEGSDEEDEESSDGDESEGDEGDEPEDDESEAGEQVDGQGDDLDDRIE